MNKAFAEQEHYANIEEAYNTLVTQLQTCNI